MPDYRGAESRADCHQPLPDEGNSRKKTPANHRHHRHDRHLGEEAPYLSRSFGDDHRDDGVTVTSMEVIIDRHAETP